MIGDFTKFFDMLDHNYLKRQWCSLLEVERLPKDHFAVFKNITQFSMFELTDILRLNGLDDSIGGRRALNKQQRALTKEQFRSNKSLVKKNPNPWGIPQGSPISGLLANLYMLEIDKQIYDFVSAVGGLYMRYSDDFIIVLPRKKNQDSEVILKQIPSIIIVCIEKRDSFLNAMDIPPKARILARETCMKSIPKEA